MDKWMIIGEVFERGEACEGCSYSYSYPDRWDEPGGRECRLMDDFAAEPVGRKREPEDCPGFEKMKWALEHQDD
jgi:hypothetical protein